MRRFIASLLTLSCMATYPAHANDEDKWWFDIEVMLFTRDTALSDLPELFERQQVMSPPKTDWDLLTEYYQPDITMVYSSLPVCDAPSSPLWVEAPTVDEIIRDYYIEPEPVELTSDVSQPEMANTEASFAEQTSNVSDLESPPSAFTDNEVESPGLMESATQVEELPQEIIPPEPGAIAAYWLSYMLNEEQLSPFKIKRRRMDCVASHQPTLDPKTLEWQLPDLYVPPRQQTPLYVHGANFKRANGPHLLPVDALKQDDIYTSIRWRKGIDRLAHFSWRQQVKFGQDNAEKLRLFAGQNYAQQFTQNGDLRPQDIQSESETNIDQDTDINEPVDTFFAELNQRLNNPQPISFAGMTAPPEANDDGNQQSDLIRLSPIWQLDGFIQVYLKYVNRVPYLHINSELFYRQPVLSANTMPGAPPAYELVSVPFTQQRRVISTQLHYFDHPMFGMLVQIRRYERPAAPKTTGTSD